MIRFVVIASLKRGAIEPAEVLDDLNQAAAISRYEADENGLGEVVCWHRGVPYVTDRRLPGTERLPKISAHLRMSVADTWPSRS